MYMLQIGSEFLPELDALQECLKLGYNNKSLHKHLKLVQYSSDQKMF